MSKYAVVVFPDEAKAYEGVRAFNDLHNEGSLTLYASGVVTKDNDGTFVVKESQDEGPVGTAIGMLMGGLIGVLAGPAGVAIGMTGGAFVGVMADLNDAGVGMDFIGAVGDEMVPGTTAVVSEVDEYWSTPLDTRMDAIGGVVFRRTRADFEDEQFEQEVKAWNDEMDELDAEIKEASGEAKAKLQTKRDDVRKHLEDAKSKADEKVSRLKNEQQAKISKLEKQVASAKADAKTKIEKRKEEVKKGYHARIAKLNEANDLIREALS